MLSFAIVIEAVAIKPAINIAFIVNFIASPFCVAYFVMVIKTKQDELNLKISIFKLHRKKFESANLMARLATLLLKWSRLLKLYVRLQYVTVQYPLS